VFIEQQLFQFALGGAAWVLWLLVGLSVLCFTIAFERLIYSLLNATPTGPFQAAVNAFFKGGDAAALERELSQMKGLEARVLAAGVEATLRNGPEAGEAVTAGTLLSERLKLERGLLVIGTVGSNSPFLGLFGTVLGIIKAFKDLSMDNAEGMSSVMSGISEALVATAAGLIVAIPAVVLYNWFQRRNKERLGRLESLAAITLARLRSASAQPHGGA
jgi:biopolymer transport protein ExbB